MSSRVGQSQIKYWKKEIVHEANTQESDTGVGKREISGMTRQLLERLWNLPALWPQLVLKTRCQVCFSQVGDISMGISRVYQTFCLAL